MDISSIRQARLRQLIQDEFKGNQKLFSDVTGIKAPQVNRWLSTTTNDRRSITEQSARKIESKTGKPERWLDTLDESEARFLPKPKEKTQSNAKEDINNYFANPLVAELISYAERLNDAGLTKLVGMAQILAVDYPKALSVKKAS